MNNYSIETFDLTKKFDGFTAVDKLNLKIKEGELFGLLGPNGAGKTTTIRMLVTLTKPSSGTATLKGMDIVKDDAKIRKIIGVVPQHYSLYDDLTAWENLGLIAELYQLNRGDAEKRMRELLERFELGDWRDELAGTFSGGMKQRLSIIAGLLHKPEILFLDEPTTGLDPKTRNSIREITRELNKEGITIIHTTHDMDEADKLCERIAIIHKGDLIALDTPAGLKKMVKSGKQVMILRKPSEKLYSDVKKLGCVYQTMYVGEDLNVIFNEKCQNEVEKIVNAEGGKSKEVYEMETTLEDVFLQLTAAKDGDKQRLSE